MYPEFDERRARLRAFVLSLGGSFVFILSSIMIVAYTSQYLYLGVAALSLGGVYLIYSAVKSLSVSGQIVYLLLASAMLATEASAVALVLPQLVAGAYCITTLGSCLVAARGIRDIETFIGQDAYPRRRKELQTIAGGP